LVAKNPRNFAPGSNGVVATTHRERRAVATRPTPREVNAGVTRCVDALFARGGPLHGIET
jgi:hypothetical protein